MNVLSRAQVEFYQTNGFLRVEQVFTDAEVRDLSAELERLMHEWAVEGPGWKGPWRLAYLTAAEDAQAKLTAMHDLQFYSEAYVRAVTNPTLAGIVADLLGPNVELHHSTLHAKAPEMGTPFPMHQDHPFYPHEGPDFVDAIVHIDDATEANGCLKFLPGSHKLGPLEHIRDGSPHLPTDQYRLADAVAVPAKAGDVVLFSYYTIHGSAPNRTDQWRRLVRFGYRNPDNVQVAGQSLGRPGLMVRGHKRKRAAATP
ncbi:MAG: phytanoyl-CoA dioxygenase family protein [Actinobacteria bacterium]|nr:phytanoyl-CoA dioxygenase family protein [Actinomycetota bacterium]